MENYINHMNSEDARKEMLFIAETLKNEGLRESTISLILACIPLIISQEKLHLAMEGLSK